MIVAITLSQFAQIHDEKFLEIITDWFIRPCFSGISKSFSKLTVARVTRNNDSWLTFSTSGELFIIVLTLANGRLAPPFDIFRGFLNRILVRDCQCLKVCKNLQKVSFFFDFCLFWFFFAKGTSLLVFTQPFQFHGLILSKILSILIFRFCLFWNWENKTKSFGSEVKHFIFYWWNLLWAFLFCE